MTKILVGGVYSLGRVWYCRVVVLLEARSAVGCRLLRSEQKEGGGTKLSYGHYLGVS